VPKVLVVEDDLNIRNLLEVRLRGMGHRVLVAASAGEALNVLTEKGTPDVAVLDVLMPGRSGLELLAELRADPAYAEMPVIFLSGRVQESDIAAGRALGATYLTKPVVLSALAGAIDRSLAAASGW